MGKISLYDGGMVRTIRIAKLRGTIQMEVAGEEAPRLVVPEDVTVERQ